MKKYTLLFMLLIIALVNTMAQSPKQFKYQAVLRDASGNIISNQQKTVIINILQGSSTGSAVFTETHNVTTNSQGIINLNIGSIQTLNLDWSSNSYFIKITVGGIEMGTSQLLSVPYALNSYYSETANYNNLTNKPVNSSITQAGFMSAADKTKLDGIAVGSEVNVNADWNAVSGDAQILNKPVNATISVSGFMNASDKVKLDGIAVGAEVNVNADWNAVSGDAQILNKPLNATTSVSGFMSAADKTKLDGVAVGAEVNVNADWNAVSGDAQILNKPTIPIVHEVADQFTASTSQTSFTLSNAPSANSKVKMYINGIRISNSAYSISGTTVTYSSASNGSYNLISGDRIQFDYYY
jgi:hypothetical protein